VRNYYIKDYLVSFHERQKLWDEGGIQKHQEVDEVPWLPEADDGDDELSESYQRENDVL
jgi:hypothetical protein